MKKYIAAIDLGTTKVVTIIGEKLPSGRIHVLAHCESPSKGVIRGEVVNIDDVVNITKSAIEEIKQTVGIEFSDVYVGVAGQHIRCIESRFDIPRDNYLETISEKEIRKLEENMYNIMLCPGEEVLHVIPQSYNVDNDWIVRSPVGITGRKLEANFKVFVGRTASAERTRLAVERMGLKLNRIVLEPIASARAVLHEEEKEVGVVLVDIGGGTTDLVVYYDKVVRHTAVIPFGGNIITEDIRQGCGVLPRHAEQLKVQYGSCYSDLAVENKIITIPGVCGREPREVSFKLLAQIIEARMDEIIEAVMFEIERSGYADKLFAGIVITGGGAYLEHLPEFVRYKTGLDVHRRKPIYVSSDSSEEVIHCTYATAIGLLMLGFDYEEEKERQKKELVPVEVTDKGKAGNKKPFLLHLFDIPKKENDKPTQLANTDGTQQGYVVPLEFSEGEKPQASLKSPKQRKAPKPPKAEKSESSLFADFFIDNIVDNNV
ncbi:MAG: cell division protein FtsA [Bacteroidales bacterium]|nr:cell division protein FtsA [Bacteroidales bacterium]MCL2133236.1 cell division protein FtsA [Bacteroidales bacterium]